MNPLSPRTSLIVVLLLSAGRLDAGAANRARGLTHIGTQKQLFIDDYIVERTSHVKRVLNHGVKAPNNPVLKADQPWETNYLRLNKIVYDDKDGLFKMWYSATDEFKPKEGARSGVPMGMDTGGGQLHESEGSRSIQLLRRPKRRRLKALSGNFQGRRALGEAQPGEGGIQRISGQ